MRRHPLKLAVAALFTFALLASACGSGDETTAGADPAAPASSDGDAAAPGSDDIRLLEILDVDTGETTTLADTADGDRPVLLWFWAPH